MKGTLILATLLVTALGIAQQPAQPQPATPPVIRGSGCVTKAVESNCLVLNDSKSGETYNLLFADHAPAPGSAIRFQATAHQGMTTCMQGKAVNVVKWKALKDVKCPSETETQH
jgi:hypothetical protein